MSNGETYADSYAVLKTTVRSANLGIFLGVGIVKTSIVDIGTIHTGRDKSVKFYYCAFPLIMV